MVRLGPNHPAGARGQTRPDHLAAARGQTLKLFVETATKDSPLGRTFQNNFELFKLKLGIWKFILTFAEEF